MHSSLSIYGCYLFGEYQRWSCLGNKFQIKFYGINGNTCSNSIRNVSVIDGSCIVDQNGGGSYKYQCSSSSISSISSKIPLINQNLVFIILLLIVYLMN